MEYGWNAMYDSLLLGWEKVNLTIPNLEYQPKQIKKWYQKVGKGSLN